MTHARNAQSESKTRKTVNKIITLVKYLLAFAATCRAALTMGQPKYILVCGIELLIVACITELFLQKNRKAGLVIHYLLFLLYNVQIGLLYFSSSFLSQVMLANVGMLEDLSGSMKAYLSYAFVVMLYTFAPPCALLEKKPGKKAVIAGITLLLVLETGGIFGVGGKYSIAYNTVDLVRQYIFQRRIQGSGDIEAAKARFYKDQVTDQYPKPVELPENPNVILIFTEGLSTNVIYDERNVMPNVKSFLDQSIRFDSYFNHTAATYMGLSGQLYSGYQQKNTDRSNLPGLQDILSDHGYTTSFINPEPNNADFTSFLNDLGWDEFLGDKAQCDTPLSGKESAYISDGKMYELLLAHCEDQAREDEPFFTAMYTFGTHVSLDSVDKTFGDGSDKLLNRFYNLDYCFGQFMQAFMESDLADDTIVIFTADHATYPDYDFRVAFPNIQREGYVSEVPFGICYKGLAPEVYNVNGRNSLCLTPTILDFLDISAENYFLGSSLFSDAEQGEFETIYQSLSTLFDTRDGQVNTLSGSEGEYYARSISDYFSLKSGEVQQLVGLKYELLDDGASMKLIAYNVPSQYNYVVLPMWSTKNGQDDFQLLDTEKAEDGIWEAAVDLSVFVDSGEYDVHIYAAENAENPDLVLLGGETITYTVPGSGT